jgi:hypothetical protein
MSVSDSANAVSRALVEQLGGHISPLDSMEWFRLLRPASFIVASAAARTSRVPRRLLYPATGLADRWLRRVSPAAAIRTTPPEKFIVEEVTADAFADAAPDLLEPYPVRPAWSSSDWAWLLRQAERKTRYGPLKRYLVHHRKGDIAGGFLYYSRPREVADVLHVLARPRAIRTVVDSLMAHLDDQGCAAVRGRTQPLLISELFRHGCSFRHRSSTVFYARDPELRAALQAGGGFLGGFVGESWARWTSDAFDEAVEPEAASPAGPAESGVTAAEEMSPPRSAQAR